MINKKIIILWECPTCKRRHTSQKGYNIRCSTESCEGSTTYKILDVYITEETNTSSPFLNKTKEGV